MPRRSKGPRLWCQKARYRDGRFAEAATWIIRDGKVKRGTGVCADDDRQPPPEAERELEAYLAEKHRKAAQQGCRPITGIPVADVINLYVASVENPYRPKEFAARTKALVKYWWDKTLADVTGETCRDYIAKGGTVRQLEDLRSAINYHLREGKHREIVKVALPPKGEPRDVWLTRSQAAKLIWAAWRYREVQKGKPTGRHSRRHVARFILVGIYTGTRAGAICAAALKPTTGCGWVNTDTGIFYRRPQGERETNKRKGPVRLPDGLLAHIRRWKRLGICRSHIVEWNGKPVRDVHKAFGNAVKDASLSAEVTPHVLKHTAVTWAMQNGMSKEDAASFFSTTIEVIERVYWHHHPDYQRTAAAKMGRHRQITDSTDRNEREQTSTKVVNLYGKA